jgi:hypothetical protein
MRKSMKQVLDQIRGFCDDDIDGPMISFGQQLNVALDQMVEALAKFDDKLTEEDKIATSQSIDVMTGAMIFMATLEIDRKKATDKIIDGYSFAMATRFFDLSPIELSDRDLQPKIEFCKQLIELEHGHKIDDMKRIKKESKAMTDAIISKLKGANQCQE